MRFADLPKDDPRRLKHYERARAWFKTAKGRANDRRRWAIEMQNPERKASHNRRQRHNARYNVAFNQAVVLIALEALEGVAI